MWRLVDLNSRELKEVETMIALLPKAKYLADENISLEEVEVLREEGVDVKSVYEFGCRGKPDSFILSLARKKRRFILTRDKDFWDDRKVPFHQIRGIGIVLLEGDYRLLLRRFWLIVYFLLYGEMWRGMKTLFSMGEIWIRRVESGKIVPSRYKIDEKGRLWEWVDN